MKSNPKLQESFKEHLPPGLLISDLLSSAKAKQSRLDDLKDPILILQLIIHNENLAKSVYNLEQEILCNMG
jgi:hypothetical protein